MEKVSLISRCCGSSQDDHLMGMLQREFPSKQKITSSTSHWNSRATYSEKVYIWAFSARKSCPLVRQPWGVFEESPPWHEDIAQWLTGIKSKSELILLSLPFGKFSASFWIRTLTRQRCPWEEVWSKTMQQKQRHDCTVLGKSPQAAVALR